MSPSTNVSELWHPTPDYVQRSRLLRFMQRHRIADYPALYDRSIGEMEWFRKAGLEAIGGASGRPSGSLSPHASRGRHHHAGLLQARSDLHADFLWLWGGGGGGAGAGLRGDAAGDSRRLHAARRVGEDEASRG